MDSATRQAQWSRTVTEKNFDVFRRLIDDVHLKAHGKPAIALSETAANGITQLIETATGRKITGRTLRAYTRAAMDGDFKKVNPKLYTLHCLAEFVVHDQRAVTVQATDHPYWYDYEKKFFEANARSLNVALKLESNSSIEARTSIARTSIPSNADSIKTSRQDYARACTVGGFVAGISNALLVILLPKILSGYFGFEDRKLFELVPLITISNVAGATLLGWFCGWLAWTAEATPRKGLKFKELVVIAAVTLSAIVFFKQMASRPLLENGRSFGRIDFETVSWFLMALVGVGALIAKLRDGRRYDDAQLLQQTILIAITALLPVMIVYFVFRFFVQPSVLHQMVLPSQDFDIIKLNFPHPERILLVALMSLISVFCILIAKRFFLANQN